MPSYAVAAWLAAAALAAPAAADEPPGCPPGAPAGAMSESGYRAVEEAIEHLGSSRYAEAEKRLTQALERSKGYERAVIQQTLGYVYAEQNAIGKALGAFEEALALDALPRKPQEDLLLNVGQILAAEGRHAEAVSALERYLAFACTPRPEARLLLASALAEREDYERALAQVRLVVDATEAPKAPWLEFAIALHYELGHLADCARLLMRLIALVPDNADYWKQLSSVLLEAGRDSDAVTVLAVAERNGLVRTERDILNLTSLYLSLEMPYRAGMLLEGALGRGVVEPSAERFRQLSDAWIAAREWPRAAAALERAAELADDGEPWLQLARVAIEQEQWRDAQSALEKALDAGVADVGEARYLHGIAAYYAGDRAAAQASLAAAARDGKWQDPASQWLDYLRSN